jgi:hypothetical protein
VVQQTQIGIQLQDAFAVVVGCRVRIVVTGTDEHVAVGFQRRPAGLPDRAEPVVGGHVERDLVVPASVERHEPSVIRPTIAVIAAVADIHAAVPDRERRSLLYIQRVLPAAGIGVRGHLDDPGADIQADELMMDHVVSVLHGRDHEDHVGGRVDHRR